MSVAGDVRLHDLLSNYLYPIHTSPTAADTLQEFIDIDVTADDLERILNDNPAYKEIFEQYIVAKGGDAKSEDEGVKQGEKPRAIPTQRLIALLGMLSSRNFILALRLEKAMSKKFPFNEKGELVFNPADSLKYSLEMEEFYQRNRLEYGETLFAAAYLYDHIHSLVKRSQSPKIIDPFLQAYWKMAVRVGMVAQAMASKIPNFPFHKYAGAAGICTLVGKPMMALHFSSAWFEFQNGIDKAKVPPHPFLTMLEERERFPLVHEEMSALVVGFFSVFRQFEKAVRYYQDPLMLKNTDRSQYQLAAVLNISATVARLWRMPASETDPLMQEFKLPWLKDLKLTNKTLIEVIRQAMTLKY